MFPPTSPEILIRPESRISPKKRKLPSSLLVVRRVAHGGVCKGLTHFLSCYIKYLPVCLSSVPPYHLLGLFLKLQEGSEILQLNLNSLKSVVKRRQLKQFFYQNPGKTSWFHSSTKFQKKTLSVKFHVENNSPKLVSLVLIKFFTNFVAILRFCDI